MIRFFSVVAPGEAGDLPHRYLLALSLTDRPLRALPIGPAVAMSLEKRWNQLAHLYTTPMTIPFVNVVCAPIGLSLGTRAPVKVLGGTADLTKREGGIEDIAVFPPELRRALGRQKDHDDLVYEPMTAFSGMWTARIRNVAIVLTDDLPDLENALHRVGTTDVLEAEMKALAEYDVIISPSEAVTQYLRMRLMGRGKLSRITLWIPPPRSFDSVHVKQFGADQFVPSEGGDFAREVEDAATLINALEDVCCESATTANTESSPATAARRATTARRLLERMASNSRSPSSATSSPPPKRGIGRSIASPFRWIASAVTSMWK